ncbi:hypothetical protein Stube_63680 [Streptomyces tubercidicus]|uniref:Uncharacterized protein n=1 Tax=Streptomyces tubercidicus TaxID=47759 RepID=A0A640V470_9ACTN|nr:hypothetical protein Stube_63680 [Streptomyces tubercidicus]
MRLYSGPYSSTGSDDDDTTSPQQWGVGDEPRPGGAALERSGNGRAEFPPGDVISAAGECAGERDPAQTQLVGPGGR